MATGRAEGARVESAAVQAFVEQRHRLLIDGQWVETGPTIAVVDPATGSAIGAIPEGSAAEVDRAVAAARASFDDGRWRGLSADARSVIMWRFAELIDAHAAELAAIEVLDNGMPMAFAHWEVNSAASWMRHYAGLTRTLYGLNGADTVSGSGAEIHAYTLREPVGVAALIVPWNAPLGNLTIKLAPALAAGCSIVAKPAEDTSLSALRLGALALEAGIPEGVLNVVTGYGPVVGQALVNHPGVDKISFTGSTETGKRIAAAASATLKRVTLELGGKSPVLVFDDADIDAVIPQVAMAIFANSGQVCFAGSRLFVQPSVFDKVVDGVAAFARDLKVGSGFDPEVMVGPLVSAKQQERVNGFIERGVADGAAVVTGGNALAHGGGFFIEPTVFANVGRDMAIVREEIFGPVLVATPIDDPEAMIAQANDTRYGLGAGLFTRDVSRVHRIARRLQAGNVWVNGYGTVHPSMPFGGMKESGLGREMGAEGLGAYMETKSVFVHM